MIYGLEDVRDCTFAKASCRINKAFEEDSSVLNSEDILTLRGAWLTPHIC